MDPHEVQQQLLRRKFPQGSTAAVSPSDAPSISEAGVNLQTLQTPVPSAIARKHDVVIQPPPLQGHSGDFVSLIQQDPEYQERLRRQSIHAAIAAVPSTLGGNLFTGSGHRAIVSPLPTPISPGSYDTSGHNALSPMSGMHSLLQNTQQNINTPVAASGLQQGPQSPAVTEASASPTGLFPELITKNDGAHGRRASKAENKLNIPVGVSGATGITPLRDGEGKFPCPNCNKTYLHAKHLKRHLLRHTGDRPYQCVICKDTFSRSDILKRHFQKCTIRNGNPTGASHLAYSDQHKSRKAAAAANAVLAAKGGLPSRRASREVLSERHGALKASCLTCFNEGLFCSGGNPCEQCASNGRGCTPRLPGRRASQGTLPPVTFTSFSGIENEFPVGYGQEFNFPSPHHPHEYLQHDQKMSDMDGLRTSLSEQTQTNSVELRPSANSTGLGETGWGSVFNEAKGDSDRFGLEFIDDGFSVDFFHGFWPPFSTDTLEFKCNHITDQLRALSLSSPSPNAVESPASVASSLTDNLDGLDLKEYFSPENVRKFQKEFSTHFLAHFPLLHLPTFDVSTAADSLIMAIVCMGAVYTPGCEVGKVRSLMDRCLSYIERRETELLESSDSNAPIEGYLSEMAPSMIQEILASSLFHILMTWHGNNRQRDRARRTFSRVVELARIAKLFNPLGASSPGYSPLHQLTQTDAAGWDWHSWVGQELRVRLMFAIHLLDCAFVIYFSTKPTLALLEVNLPLPANDEAWEAATAEECAFALGIQPIPNRTPPPNCKSKQIGFREAIQQLLGAGQDFAPGSTNAYGKFILIHALHANIWIQQDRHYRLGTFAAAQNRPLFFRAPTDWRPAGSHAPISNLPGVRRNSVSAPSGPNQKDYMEFVKSTNLALEKWKVAWDADLAAQFPDPSKRVGFCRDGLPFYWLAKIFMKHGANPEWRRGRDDEDTLAKVQKLLRKVNDFIQQDSKGVDLQGAVAAIDDNYAMDELTFNMKLLFTPVKKDDRTLKEEGISSMQGVRE